MGVSKKSPSVEETKRALLEAGRKIFASEGFAGARVDRIARQAGVNKALINYHFGGKAQLFKAIIEDFTQDLARGLLVQIRESDGPETQLRCFIRYMAEMVSQNPEFPRLLLFESQRLQTEPESPPLHLFLIIQTLGKILERGQSSGVLKPINHFFAHFHIMSSFAMYELTRPLREAIRGKAPIPEEVFSTEAFHAFVESQIMAGFLVDPHGSARE